MKLKPHKCGICGWNFSFKPNLNVHLKTVHKNVKDYGCDSCGMTFTAERLLKNHIQNNHKGKYFECDICGKKIKGEKPLESHKKHLHKTNIFQCDFCNKSFTREEWFLVHVRQKHPIDEKLKNATIEPKPALEKIELKASSNVDDSSSKNTIDCDKISETKKASCKCNICKKTFDDVDTL